MAWICTIARAQGLSPLTSRKARSHPGAEVMGDQGTMWGQVWGGSGRTEGRGREKDGDGSHEVPPHFPNFNSIRFPHPFLRTHPIPKRPPPDRASASQGHAPTMPGMHAEVSTPAPYCLLTGSEVVHIRARAAHAGGMACDEILSGKRPRHFWGTKHPHEYGIEKRAMR